MYQCEAGRGELLQMHDFAPECGVDVENELVAEMKQFGAEFC